MRFIDEKGKVFGAINIFDLIILILIGTLVISASIFQLKRSYVDNVGQELKGNNVYKDVKAEAYLMSEVANRIKKGDRLVDKMGDVVVEMAGIVSNQPFFVESANGDKADDVLNIFTAETKNNFVSCVEPGTFLYVGTLKVTAKDSVKFAELRKVVVRLKVLCKTYRDDAIKLVQNSLPLRIGTELGFYTNDYCARFTIIEIE